ncbi:lipopolysaccharide biosynthesis protein [Curtobacterium sp. MCBD17_030]|uniref:lipopolysaccharide biosynthesis protein n=1 Tax=Curtobacterium sp. MCBD17_030 TaxID=2175649 RepID=UPI0015E8DA9C|nr:oligosaccharide flippase family protein [Curtobacterium sp. MCBD17_030]
MISNAVPPMAAFLCAPLLAQGLGLEQRGAVAAATAPLLLAISSITFGLPEAVTYFVARGRGQATVWKSCLAILIGGLLATVGLWVLAPILSGGNDRIAKLIAISALSLTPALLLGVFRAAAGAVGLWQLTALESVVGAVMRLVWVGLLFLSDNLNPLSATVAMSVTLFVGIVAYAPLTRAAWGDAPGNAQPRYGELFHYGSRVWIGSLSGILLTYLDQTIMTPLSSARELGLYSVCVSISAVVLVFNTTLRGVVFAAESAGPVTHRLVQSTRLSNLATVLIASLVALVSPWGLPLLFGAEFTGATPVLFVLLLAVVLGNPGSLAGVGLSARGRPEMRSMSLAVACVINAALVVVLVPDHGAMGAAWATVVGNVVSAGLNLMWMKILFAVPVGAFLIPRRGDTMAANVFARRMLGR